MADLTSEIGHFYRGRSVFITGASGFIGKVLVEKLLRSCPDIAQIFVLMRPKRGKDAEMRLRTLLSAQLFDLIRESHPALLKKVCLVNGDITLPGLGIPEPDALNLRQSVSIIFHVAATVKFSEPLKDAVLKNVIGTKSVIQFAKNVQNLAVVMHISTAYAHCDRKVIEDVLYPPPVDPEKFMSWLEWANDDFVNEITPVILGKRPNTYTYTKALAEGLFAKECAGLPSAIIRPSIVTSSWKEPFPGWVDNLNGPGGITAGAGKGLVRTLRGDERTICGFIPVDILVNLMIAVAWRTATSRTGDVLVYNCTSTSENTLCWKQFQDMLYRNMYTKPYKEVHWYPGGTLTKFGHYHQFRVFFYHLVPAYIIDGVGHLFGKKPQMVNVTKKIWRAMDSLQFFVENEWKFTDEKTKELHRMLSPKDRELFNFDIAELNWDDYLDNFYMGIKAYIFKEPADSKETNFYRIRTLKRILDLALYGVILRFFWIWTPSTFKKIFYPLLDCSLQVARFFNVGLNVR